MLKIKISDSRVLYTNSGLLLEIQNVCQILGFELSKSEGVKELDKNELVRAICDSEFSQGDTSHDTF